MSADVSNVDRFEITWTNDEVILQVFDECSGTGVELRITPGDADRIRRALWLALKRYREGRTSG